jgi:hypothetical protein
VKAKSHIPHGETSAWIAAACLLLVAAASGASPSAGGRDLAALEIPAGRAVPGDGVMEIRIALSTLSPPPSPGKVFGLALDVTDTKASWSFWPAGAALERPASWGKAMLVGAPR